MVLVPFQGEYIFWVAWNSPNYHCCSGVIMNRPPVPSNKPLFCTIDHVFSTFHSLFWARRTLQKLNTTLTLYLVTMLITFFMLACILSHLSYVQLFVTPLLSSSVHGILQAKTGVVCHALIHVICNCLVYLPINQFMVSFFYLPTTLIVNPLELILLTFLFSNAYNIIESRQMFENTS